MVSTGYSSFNGSRNFSADAQRFLVVAFKAGLYVDVFGRSDTKTNTIAADFQNGDLDFFGDDDLLIFLAADYEHRDELLLFRRPKEEL